MRKQLYILILSLVCCFGLHAQQRYFSIEVREPAKLQLPAGRPEVRTLLVVNNTVTQPDNFGHKNKRNDQETGVSAVELQDAARQCVFGAQEVLDAEGVYEEVGVISKSQNEMRNFYRRTPLTAQRADSLMDFYGADAILVLNQLVLYDVLESFETENDTYYAYLQAYCSMQWSIHYKGKTNPLTFTKSDTLYWAEEDTQERVALAGLPDRQTALLDFAYYAGEESAKMLYPQWVPADRYVYCAKSEAMDTALRSFTRQQWNTAFEQWQTIAMSASETAQMRAYASADMALCAEMMGDYDAAIRCVNQAVQLLEKVRTMEALQQRVNLIAYRDELGKRKNAKF